MHIPWSLDGPEFHFVTDADRTSIIEVLVVACAGRVLDGPEFHFVTDEDRASIIEVLVAVWAQRYGPMQADFPMPFRLMAPLPSTIPCYRPAPPPLWRAALHPPQPADVPEPHVLILMDDWAQFWM